MMRQIKLEEIIIYVMTLSQTLPRKATQENGTGKSSVTAILQASVGIMNLQNAR
jgi:hypothetical protein